MVCAIEIPIYTEPILAICPADSMDDTHLRTRFAVMGSLNQGGFLESQQLQSLYLQEMMVVATLPRPI